MNPSLGAGKRKQAITGDMHNDRYRPHNRDRQRGAGRYARGMRAVNNDVREGWAGIDHKAMRVGGYTELAERDMYM